MIGMINSKYKTSMCRHYEQNGTCQLGARCHFAHGKDELRKMTDPIPTVSQTQSQQPMEQAKPMSSQGQMGGFQSSYPLVPSSNYKTVKCKYFEKGYCKYNQSCSFAHGDTDMRMTSSKQDQPSPMQSTPYTQPTSQSYGNPLMDPTIQNSIAQQQIQYLIQQMENYHANNQQLMVSIKNAQELNNANNTQTAATLLYEIIQRQDKSKEDADNYNNFLAAIQQLGTQLFQQLTVQYGSQSGGNDMYGQSYGGSMGYGGGGMGSQGMGFSGGMGGSGGYGGGQGMMMGGQSQSQMSGGQYTNGGVKGFSSK